MNYYERHLGDYARDAGHLTMLEHGAYTLLLDRYYTTGNPIPESQAHRLCRAQSPEERAAVDAVLGEFFTLFDGHWHNRRADGELAKAAARIEVAKNNGRRGGRPKAAGIANETHQEPSGFSLGTPDRTQIKAHHAPPNHLTTKEQKQLVRQAARFDDFWAVYPNKKGKQEAEKRWRRDGLDAMADSIIAHVHLMTARDDAWQRGFAPMGSTYLNQARWTDEPSGPAINRTAPGKQMTGLMALAGMKNGVVQERNHHGYPEAGLLGAGASAGGRGAAGDGFGMAGGTGSRRALGSGDGYAPDARGVLDLGPDGYRLAFASEDD